MTGPLPRALPSAMATAPPGMRSPVKATNSPNTPPVAYSENGTINDNINDTDDTTMQSSEHVQHRALQT